MDDPPDLSALTASADLDRALGAACRAQLVVEEAIDPQRWQQAAESAALLAEQTRVLAQAAREVARRDVSGG